MPSLSPYIFFQEHKVMLVTIFTVIIVLNIIVVVLAYKEQKRSPMDQNAKENYYQAIMYLVVFIITGPGLYGVAYGAEKFNQKMRDKDKKDHPGDSVVASSSSSSSSNWRTTAGEIVKGFFTLGGSGITAV